MKIFNTIIITLLLLSSVAFAKSVGAITALQGSASILRDTQEIEATLGAKLNEKDSITTKDATKVQVVFDDDTTITIGKNSNFSINEYLYEESKEPTAKFGLVNGAMRTITGKIGKIAPDKFSVQTKTATIGIRGTNFTIIAELDGSSRVYCTFGAISVSIRGELSTVTQGFYVVVSPDGKRSEPMKFTPAELGKMKDDNFSSIENQKEKESKQVKESTELLTTTDAKTQIDTTRVEKFDLDVKDITKHTTDATQVNIVNKIEEIEAARITAEAARISAEAAAAEAARIAAEAAAAEAARIAAEAAAAEAARIAAEAAAAEAARIAAEAAAAAAAAAAATPTTPSNPTSPNQSPYGSYGI